MILNKKNRYHIVIVLSVILLAGVGYLVYERLKVPNDLAVLIPTSTSTTPEPTISAVTPTPSLPPATPTPAPTATPKPPTRLGYVQEQLLLAGFDAGHVQQLVSDTRLSLYPVKQVAYKEPNWPVIEQKLYADAFVQKGKDYIKANQTIFDNAEKDYGVPKEVLAGVIAIETEFGQNSGTTPTFNALYSRMMQWPETTWKGQAAQLVALSTYCLRSQRDCFAIQGSYAGALGIVQFMPNSLLAYGIDGNGDGIVDLLVPADAIPSAANFLKNHGWAQNQLLALTRYYGSSVGYPQIVLTYASLLKN